VVGEGAFGEGGGPPLAAAEGVGGRARGVTIGVALAEEAGALAGVVVLVMVVVEGEGGITEGLETSGWAGALDEEGMGVVASALRGGAGVNVAESEVFVEGVRGGRVGTGVGGIDASKGGAVPFLASTAASSNWTIKNIAVPPRFCLLCSKARAKGDAFLTSFALGSPPAFKRLSTTSELKEKIE